MEADKQFLEMIVKNIVSNPEDVVVERTVDEMGVLLTLKTNPADMGYVIGRKGQTAQAIRTLLKIVGAKNNSRVNLKIFDPEGGARRTSRPTESTEGTQSTPSAPSADLADVDTSALDDLKI